MAFIIRNHHYPSRRSIVQAGLGAGLIGCLWNWARPVLAQEVSGPIAMRPIPHSGEPLPVVGVGTAINFSVGQDQRKKAALREVIEVLMAGGGKVIDTASSYGSAESVIGSILSGQDRPKLFIATKLEHGRTRTGGPELQHSLARLRMANVDLLQLHNVNNPNQSLSAFRDWKDRGLCRYVGITTTDKRYYDAAGAILRREKPDFFQVDYSVDNRGAENRVLPAAANVGAAILVALPLGRKSVLAAVRGRPLPAVAREFDAVTWPQFFLKFLLGNPAVTTVIPGTGNPQHMADDLAAGRGRFPDAEQRKAMISYFKAL